MQVVSKHLVVKKDERERDKRETLGHTFKHVMIRNNKNLLENSITLFRYMVVFMPYLALDMGLHYLTFMGRNLNNRKKLMPI